jgi:hypothetical protein
VSAERGLVISVPVQKIGTWSMRKFYLDDQELRFSLLLWDKLDMPRAKYGDMDLVSQNWGGEDADFLESVGILNRTVTNFAVSDESVPAHPNVTPNLTPELLHQTYLAAYRALDRAEPGVWSLGVGKNSVSFPERDLNEGRGVMVRLYEAIPVPDKDVPIQDILEFKAKYGSELLDLRHHLDLIFQRIIAAGDGELALKSEVDALERSIIDYLKAAKGTSIPFINTTVEANLNIPAAITAGLAACSAGLSTVTSLLAGAAAGIGFGLSASLKNHKASSTPFRYISSFHKRVF